MFLGQHSIAKLIDHTLLKADADRKSIERLCREAIEEGLRYVLTPSGLKQRQTF